jgi:hypothetical protein
LKEQISQDLIAKTAKDNDLKLCYTSIKVMKTEAEDLKEDIETIRYIYFII